MLETLGRTLKNGVFGVFFGHFSTPSTPGATLLGFEQPTPKSLIFLPFFLMFFKTINGAVGKFDHPETRFLRCFSDPSEAAAANKANSGFSRNLRNFFEEIYFLDRKKLEIFPWKIFDWNFLSFFDKLLEFVVKQQGLPKIILETKLKMSRISMIFHTSEVWFVQNLGFCSRNFMFFMDFTKFFEFFSIYIEDDFYDVSLLSKKSEKVLKVSWFRPSVFKSFFLLPWKDERQFG